MNGEEQKPVIGASFWFMVTVLGLGLIAYNMVPMFYAPPPTVAVEIPRQAFIDGVSNAFRVFQPKVSVTVSDEAVREALGTNINKVLEGSLQTVFDEGAMCGAKIFYMYQTKGVTADKISIKKVIDGARLIRPQIKREVKVRDGNERKQSTSKNSNTPGDAGKKPKVGNVSPAKGDG